MHGSSGSVLSRSPSGDWYVEIQLRQSSNQGSLWNGEGTESSLSDGYRACEWHVNVRTYILTYVSDENLVDMECADVVLLFKEEEKAQMYLTELIEVIPSFENLVDMECADVVLLFKEEKKAQVYLTELTEVTPSFGLWYRYINVCTFDDSRDPWILGLKSIPLGRTTNKYTPLFIFNFAASSNAYGCRIPLLINRCTQGSLIIANGTN
ncbi:hypothetical protein CLF_111134 [Clonorchis sinensis]|uniref:Uncharacterized protein n=1 Tax=Clonorchis sinensis TaxID=79923 RepID=G7YUF0_CLOSI|nr:hypothetical protein CLF_111134 [Clonorchis sinensis]